MIVTIPQRCAGALHCVPWRMLILWALAFVSAVPAQAATKMLMLSPVRAIFTERERAMAVSVSNSSQEPVTYTVSLITMHKDKNGALREVSEENEAERLAKSMIRFAPRRATIAPGTRQVVKLMVQKPADLPPGEYQTRLQFSPLASKRTDDRVPVSAATDKPQFEIDILVAASIPVVIQHGVSAEVTPTTCVVKKSAQPPAALMAEVTLARSGEASGFGNLILSHTAGRDPQGFREIGRVQGLAFYRPDRQQTVSVPLPGLTPQALATGTLRVAFEPDTGAGVKKRGKEGTTIVKDFPARIL